MSFHDMLLIENVLMNIEMFLFNGDIREETIRKSAFTIEEVEGMVNENARLRKELTETREILKKLRNDHDVLKHKYNNLYYKEMIR